ncbi:MAG: hypothetical protein AAB724_02575 [Patescibacteria group bacterium]
MAEQSEPETDLEMEIEESDEEPTEEAPESRSSPAKVSFPWLIAILALGFDLVGLIPALNIATETIAALLFGLWQTNFLPQVNPVLGILMVKLADLCTLGLLPSNLAIVVRAYIKKKSSAKVPGALTA